MPQLQPREINVNGWPAIVSAIILGTIGVLSFIIQPGIVQGYVEHLGVSDSRAVDLVGLEMLGVALATIFMALVGTRINWRTIVAAGLLIAAGGDLASALATHAPAFGGLRLIAGFGEGMIISISFTFVGVTAKAERNVALYLVLLLTYGAFGLWYLPVILNLIDMSGMFIGFAGLSTLALVAVLFVPHGYGAAQGARPDVRQLPTALLAVALLAVLAYNIAQGIAWAVLFLVGTSAGIAEQVVANALFLSQVMAVAGALASVMLAERIPRGTPRDRAIAGGILGGAASIALLLGHPDVMLFTLGVCGFNILWNFVLPFILGRIGDFDASGRMMSFAVAMQMIGLGGGPLIAAPLIDGKGFRVVELLCIALFLISFALLRIPTRAHRRLHAAP
jgi:predicted MFS family arabinose efflux permease